MSAPSVAPPARTSGNGGAEPSPAPESAAGAEAAAQPSPATTAVTNSQRPRPNPGRARLRPAACKPPSATPSTRPPATTRERDVAAWPDVTGSPTTACDTLAAVAAAVIPMASATAHSAVHLARVSVPKAVGDGETRDSCCVSTIMDLHSSPAPRRDARQGPDH